MSKPRWVGWYGLGEPGTEAETMNLKSLLWHYEEYERRMTKWWWRLWYRLTDWW